MTRRRHGLWRLLLGGLVAAGSLWGTGLLVGEAEAIIGRPLTPLSYAGVARRTTRRAVWAGAATGAYAAPPPTVPYYYW